ncbi:conserved hypothetical protein [Burkholderia sp. H160]|nr:conserved hypothetical protein [Burkholderia sp. H160]
MNTPLSGPDDLRCAEYVLGVLDARGRTQIEQAMLRDPQLAASIARWQNYLMPLNEDIDEIAPAPYVWARIQSELGFAPAESRRARVKWWDDVRLWRWIGIGSSVVAMALVGLSILPVREEPVAVPGHEGYKVARIVREGDIAGWIAVVDVERARMVIVPARGTPVAADRSTELWLIPPGARPVSLGVIDADRPTVVSLPQARLASLNARTVLAVSLEPHGGSPTGQPTGPVLAKGVVGGA